MKRWKKRTLIAVAAVLAVFVAAMAVAPLFVLPMFLGQRYAVNQHSPEEFGVEATELTLMTDDGLALAAWFVNAENPQTAKASVILVSGLQSPSVTAFFGYAKLFARHGYNSLLVELRARGQSEGEQIGFGMTEWLDVKAAADYLTGLSLPVIAMGTSMGAGTVIIAAGETDAIDAVIAASSPSNIGDLFTSYMDMMGIPRFVSALEMPLMKAHLGIRFGFDALKYTPMNAVEKLGGRPLLLMHSTGDTQVPFWEYEKLKQHAQDSGVNLTSFEREGDWHFICYDEFVYTPWEDTVFAETLLSFLDGSV